MTPLPGGADLARAFATPPGWLLRALDGAAVADVVRTTALPHDDVVGCVPLDLRLDRDGWRAWYAVTVRDAGGERSVELAGTLDPPPSGPTSGGGLRPVLTLRPAVGADLPAHHVLTDPDAAARLLERVVGGGALPGFAVTGCRPRVVRHARGARVTVVLRLDLPPDADPRWPDVVVAKAYADDEGAATHSAMTRLWASPLAGHPAVRIAPPLGYDPALRVLLQGAVPHERSLTDLVLTAVADGSQAARDRLGGVLRATADGLVALHSSGVDAGPVRTADALAARAAKQARRLGAWVPDVAAAAGPVLDALARRAAALAPDPPVPSHGGFRPAQVLLGPDDGPAFVDLDGFCRAEPAFDVGRFRARLREIVLGAPAGRDAPLTAARRALADRLADEVSARYARGAALSADRVALWEDLELVTALVQSWTRGQVTRTASLASLVAGSAG